MTKHKEAKAVLEAPASAEPIIERKILMSYDDNTTMAMMTVIGLYLIMLLAVIVIIILYCIFLSKVFKKAGVAGWKAWVPFYSQYLIAKLALGQGFWFFLIFIPYVGQIIMMVLNLLFVKTFTDKIPTLIITFFMPFVGLIILANDDTAQYNGPVRF